MGKRIISQRRGRGSSTYKSYGQRFAGKIGKKAYPKGDVMKGKVVNLVHSRGHSAPLMEVEYSNKTKALLPAFKGCYIGKEFFIDMKGDSEVKEGNAYMLSNMPEGSRVYNLEITPGDGGKIARGGGSSIRVVAHYDNHTKVQLPSKKTKLLDNKCRAIVGTVGGSGRNEKPFVKAGVKFYKKKQKSKLFPRTSGGKMSAYDHPFGNTRSQYKGRPTVAPRNAPPGRKVGMIRASRTGKRKR